MNKDKNLDRINRIKEERKLLLTEVKDSINNSNEEVINNISEIKELLNYDEESIKKYNAICEAQELIESLTKEIVNAKSHEEVIEIRKKLNYYINKVKNECKKRNISEEDYNKYYSNITDLRKNIAKYIRYLKRESNINHIDELNSNYDNLSSEEKQDLNKAIKLERNYNTRQLNPKEKEVKEEELTDSERLQRLLSESFKKEGTSPLSMGELTIESSNQEEDTYSSDREYIDTKVTDFSRRYKTYKTHHYNHSLPGNIVSFIKNVPIYKKNQKTIRRMMFDYEHFYHGDDFNSYIAYQANNNSIKEGLKSIFKHSSLYNKENLYLDTHNRCINWILHYIRHNNLELNYNKAK